MAKDSLHYSDPDDLGKMLRGKANEIASKSTTFRDVRSYFGLALQVAEAAADENAIYPHLAQLPSYIERMQSLEKHLPNRTITSQQADELAKLIQLVLHLNIDKVQIEEFIPFIRETCVAMNYVMHRLEYRKGLVYKALDVRIHEDSVMDAYLGQGKLIIPDHCGAFRILDFRWRNGICFAEHASVHDSLETAIVAAAPHTVAGTVAIVTNGAKWPYESTTKPLAIEKYNNLARRKE